MKQMLKRAISAALAIVMTVGMCVTASADGFSPPHAYWALQNAWIEAVEQEDLKEIVEVAEDTYDLLMESSGIGKEVCEILEPRCSKASWASEILGDIDAAVLWLERQQVFAQWLDDNGYDRKDTLLNIPARMQYLKAAQNMTIYVQTDEPGKAFPEAGAPTNGTWYSSVVDSDWTTEYASLMYIEFASEHSVQHWIDYYQYHQENFRKASTEGGVIEVAWNFKPESTAGSQVVLDPANDSYIEESLAAMGGLNATILLRVGAEMNSWSDSDPNTFIQAFRKIAQRAEKYNNIKMVFSPNDLGDRTRAFSDYYPGDEYVDWIGVSTYHNTNYMSKSGITGTYTFNSPKYYDDAYYGVGIYDSDPLVVLEPMIRFAEEHNKPYMISECGFSYTQNGTDQTAFAKDQLTKFYSYVNMIYPQVKAVFYFNNNAVGTYRLEGNAQMAEAYQTALANNGGYIETLNGTARTWKKLAEQKTVKDTLALATYVSFPGNNPITVTYYVDGKQMAASNQVPFRYDLNTQLLAPGKHTVKAVAVGGAFTYETTSEITVSQDNGAALYTADGWAQSHMVEAEAKKLITPRNQKDFKQTITRLQFAELAVNLIEQATDTVVPLSSETFVDTTDEVVRKAVYAGVTSGKGEGKFAPEDCITRQEICTMLVRVIEYVDKVNGTSTLTNQSTEVDTTRFNDVDQITSWAVPFVAKMTNNGLMSGKDGGVAPLQNTTVQEAVILIKALYNKF